MKICQWEGQLVRKGWREVLGLCLEFEIAQRLVGLSSGKHQKTFIQIRFPKIFNMVVLKEVWVLDC